MNASLSSMLMASGLLMGFAAFGTGLVALTYSGTKDIITGNQRAALLANLTAVLPADHYDNPLSETITRVIAPAFTGTREPMTVYHAYRGDRPVAIVAAVVAPDGYGGPIELLIGVYADGAVAGVRVLQHRETPGLGDAIEIDRSDWIRRFKSKSLGNPPLKAWKVQKDGGEFDQFTGATITPRAVVEAVRRFLVYFQIHRTQLLSAKEPASGENKR